MSLAGKFGNFKIKKTDRISKEDQEWLSRREKMYKRALMIQKSVYDIYKSEDETYTEEDRKEFSDFTVSDFGVPKRVSQIQDSYISGIFSYFSRKYHVELENKFEHYDYNRELYRYSNKEPVKDLVIDEIDYHTVLDKIFDQLGGLSFQEKSMKEVKDALKDKCYLEGRDQWKIKISGKKLIYTGGSCYKSRYSDEYEFNSTAWLRAFLDALACNMYEEKICIHPLNRLYDSYYVRLDDDDFQNGFSAPSVGVEHIKFYKNGRVDITFQSGEFCRNFAREWCGYTLV